MEKELATLCLLCLRYFEIFLLLKQNDEPYIRNTLVLIYMIKINSCYQNVSFLFFVQAGYMIDFFRGHKDRERKTNHADCYFCIVYITGFSAKNKQKIVY